MCVRERRGGGAEREKGGGRQERELGRPTSSTVET